MARLDSLPQDLRERAESNGLKPTEAPSGVELLANLIGFIRRYVALSEDQALLIALWIVHTAEIDRFIERRAQKAEPDLDEREDIWVESVRRYQERESRERRAQWYGWHCDQAQRHRRTLAALIAHHEGEAQRPLEPEEMDQAEGGP